MSQTGDNPTKITIKTVENTLKAPSAAANSGGALDGASSSASGSQDHHGHGHREHGSHHHQRPSRKRKHKEFASPTGDALIHVDINDVDDNNSGGSGANNGGGIPVVPPIASSSSSSVFSSAKTGTVQIQFDPNTKRLWQASFYERAKPPLVNG